MKLSNVLSLLSLVRRIPVDGLFQVPKDFNDLSQVKAWSKAVVDTLRILAEYTDAQWDDSALEYIESALQDHRTWVVLRALLDGLNMLISKRKQGLSVAA